MTDGIKSKTNYVFENVSKTQRCHVNTYFEPTTVAEVQEIVKSARSNNMTVRVVGMGHSFTKIVCTDGYLISLKHMNQLVEVNSADKTITVQAGITLTDLNEILAENNLSLPVLGALSEFALGGVISVGTHGSSSKVGTLSSLVTEVTLVTANADVITCNREHNTEIFLAAACSMGALGVITQVKLQCVDAFKLELIKYGENVEKALSMTEKSLESNDYFEFFWYPHTDGCMVWESNRTDKECTDNSVSWFWKMFVGVYLLLFLYWIGSFASCVFPWVNWLYYTCIFSKKGQKVDRSDKVLNYFCIVDQCNTEWSIPVSQARTAYNMLKQWLHKTGYKAQLPVEFRFAKGDDLYLSHAYGETRCYINISCNRLFGTMYPHDELWHAFENIMTSLGGRPHWAKDHTRKAKDLALVYPKWNDFQSVRRKLDPDGLFLNQHLREMLEE